MSARPAAVAAGDPSTVAAAVEVLEAGGNAFDAVVAAGLAGAVVEPALTSLGGGGFLLARTAAGDERLLDFFVDTPGRGLGRPAEPHFTPVTVRFVGADQVFHVGYGSVAVPGALDGYLQVHRRLGRLPLPDVVRPAVRLARAGAALQPMQAAVLELLHDVVTLTEEARAVFAPNGRLPHVGELIANPVYGDFLEAVAEGRITGFADPQVAGPLEAAMVRSGGSLSTADLEAYRVVERPPLAFAYRGYRVLTNPLPSFGGSLVEHGLDRLERGEPLPAVLRAISDRRLIAGLRASHGTTHVSVADGEGNVAAMTTSNGSCSGVMVPGTGVQLNNVLGEKDLHPDGFGPVPPGLRVGSMMAPTLVEGPDGAVLVLGSGGSERIRSALVQVLARLLSDEPPRWEPAELTAAVESPRLHWDGEQVQAEPGVDPAVVGAAAPGRVNVWDRRDVYFGGVHAVAVGPHGSAAAGDPRRGGSTWVGRSS